MCVYRTDRNNCCLHPSCTVHASLMQPVGAVGRTVTPGGAAAGPERKKWAGRSPANPWPPPLPIMR